MSVLTPKRLGLVVVVFLIAGAASASNPSPRTFARMAYDAQSKESVLFGGRVGLDTATVLTYASDETWIFKSKRWVQRFPLHHPEARSVHTMVYDSKRDRVVLFGGRTEPKTENTGPGLVNDTWQWNGEDWSEIDSSDSPSVRQYAGAAYDAARDRIVLFGGEEFNDDKTSFRALYDTWEFDGTNWVEISPSSAGPKVARPLLTYDAIRNQIIMLGLSETATTVMYRYDGATGSWVQLTPQTLPGCAGDGLLGYRPITQQAIFTGGICVSGNENAVETFQWDGTNWAKIATNDPGRASGQAFAYDASADMAVMFGGVNFGQTVPRSLTLFYANDVWRFTIIEEGPAARSLAAFETDPDRKGIWMLGGLADDSLGYLSEFWRYSNGQWNPSAIEGMPIGCVSPGAAYDTNRQVLVVICGGQNVFEFNGNEWKSFDFDGGVPDYRKFGGVVYDQTLRKTVMFGGYDDTTGNYKNDTWTWDGAKWARVDKDKPPNRALMAMWYDPLLHKTVIFAGLGRPDLDSKIARYEDMYSFNGNGWTKMNVTTTPGKRFGPATGIDPVTGKVLLFGGLRAEDAGENSFHQFYIDDTWQWDGAASTWTKLTPARVPAARENAVMRWDPVAEKLVLFGGYAGGLYFSDVWEWDGTTWTPRQFPITGKRRAAGN